MPTAAPESEFGPPRAWVARTRWSLATTLPLVAVMFGAVSHAHAQKRNPSEVPSAPVVQLIVKESGAIRSAAAINGGGDEMRRVQQWSAAALQPLTSKRVMSGGARILRLSTPLTASDAAAVAQRLRATGAFDYVDVDYRIHLAGVPANDTYLSQQWNLSPATSSRGGADVFAAWQRMPTGGSVTVAVVDTGITAHEDLDTSRLAAGYDFLTAETLTTTADAKTGKFLPAGFVKNDGIADRDADPSDPGDWVTVDDATNYPDLCGPAVPSSWHGTYVSGIIAATRGNGLGIAGITPFARISNARVLGRCGGVTSDLIDAMRWAAGIAVPGVPLNAEPAKVINLSLGGYSPCGPALQQAVNDVRARGVVIVAATGNDAAMGAGAPANCSGVIGVTAHTPEGDSADYANVGTGTMLSAPGGVGRADDGQSVERIVDSESGHDHTNRIGIWAQNRDQHCGTSCDRRCRNAAVGECFVDAGRHRIIAYAIGTPVSCWILVPEPSRHVRSRHARCGFCAGAVVWAASRACRGKCRHCATRSNTYPLREGSTRLQSERGHYPVVANGGPGSVDHASDFGQQRRDSSIANCRHIQLCRDDPQ